MIFLSKLLGQFRCRNLLLPFFEFLTEPTDSIETAFAAGEGRVFFPLLLPGDPLNQYILGEKNSLGEGVNAVAVSVIVLASQVTMGGKAEIETWSTNWLSTLVDHMVDQLVVQLGRQTGCKAW